MKFFRLLGKSGVSDNKDSKLTVTVSAKDMKRAESETMPATTRISNIERDVIKLFRELAEMRMAINNMERRSHTEGQHE